MVLFQSCAAGVANVLGDKNEYSGLVGFLVSILMISGSIVMIATRKEKKQGGSIATIIIFLIAAMIGFPNAGSFSDLKIWSIFCIIIAFMNVFAMFIMQKNRSIDEAETIKTKKWISHKWWFWFIVILLVTVMFSTCNNQNDSNTVNRENNDISMVGESIDDKDNTSEIKKEINIGDSFVFDDLEITVIDYEVRDVENRYSDYENAVLIKLSIKNMSEEVHGLNMFYYNAYGPNGIEVSTSLDSYFDDAEGASLDMLPDVTLESFIAIEYDGDGMYLIIFDNWTEEIDVYINVKK